MKAERRMIQGDVQVREAEGGKRSISGLAAVYYDGTPRTEFVIADSAGNAMFRERIMPGAFDGALKRGDDVVALWNHNSDKPLGRTSAGTTKLSVSAEGLWYDVDVPETQAGRDAVVSVERGDVTGSSIAFRVKKEGAEPGQRFFLEDDTEVREVLSVELMDVSPVTYPAYLATNGHVSTRDAEAGLEAYTEYREADTGEDPGDNADAQKAAAEAEALKIKAGCYELEQK